MRRKKISLCLPHGVLLPQELSLHLWETCLGNPLNVPSRIETFPQSPPGRPRAGAPSLPALTVPSASPLRQSEGP